MNPQVSRVTPYIPFLVKFLIILLGALLFFKFVGPVPFKISSPVGNDIFTMNGEGRASTKPDIAVVSLGVSANSKTVKEAQSKMNQVINKVTEDLKKLGVEEKDIKTENYNIYPNYDYSEKPISQNVSISSSPSTGSEIGLLEASDNEDSKIIDYSANTNLKIKVRDLDKVNQVIDIGTKNGANQIGGITFEVADRSKSEEEARKLAIEDARKKANIAAKAAGIKLGKVLNYYESLYPPVDSYPLYGGTDVQMDRTSTDIQPGSMEIVVTATLSYEIK